MDEIEIIMRETRAMMAACGENIWPNEEALRMIKNSEARWSFIEIILMKETQYMAEMQSQGFERMRK